MGASDLRHLAAAALGVLALACACSSADEITEPDPGGFPPGWALLSPKPGVTTYYAVAAPDPNTVVAVGAGGAIAYKSGSGEWQHPTSGTTETLLDVSFANSAVGVAVGKNAVALWTADGGRTWARRSPPTAADLQGAHFLNPAHATLVGASGAIFRTASAGASWSNLSIAATQDLRGVHFTHPDTGWAVGANPDSATLLLTTNGGTSWAPHCCAGAASIQRVAFRGSLGFAVGPSKRLWTRNRGAIWLDIALDDVQALDVAIADDLHATVVGFGGSSNQSYSYSDDGGLSWRQPGTPILRHPTTSVSFANAATGWSTGDLGTVLRTDDGGASWQWGSNVPREVLEDVFFVDANLGWVVGVPGILRTTDGGGTWALQRPPAGGGASLNGVWFTGPNNGFAVGGGVEPLLRTMNGGVSWTVLNPTMSGLRDVFFLDALRGWAVGDNVVLATTDGGNVWGPLDDGVPIWREYDAVHFVDANHGWIAGYEGRLMRTVDGGDNWTPLLLAGLGTRWRGLYFKNAAEGWMVGSDAGDGVILHTVNGGDDWADQHRQAAANFDEIRFVGDAGWAVGEVDGVALILSTTNGGMTWTDQVGGAYPRGFGLNAISLVNASVGVAAGNFGLILRTENGGRP